MALFTDGSISTLDDLAAQDSAVLDVASTEGIDVSRKLELARADLGIELTAMLVRSGQSVRAGSECDAIVVTPALKAWHTLYTLELIYRDAFNSQLNDRYKGKRDQYHVLAKQAQERLMVSGVGIANDPVPRPQPPTVKIVQGSLGQSVYVVATTWVNASGEESAASEALTIVAESGSGLSVSPGGGSTSCKGWNVYAGTSAESLRKQNDVPLGVSAVWILSSEPSTTGQPLGDGQKPSYTRATPRILQRG